MNKNLATGHSINKMHCEFLFIDVPNLFIFIELLYSWEKGKQKYQPRQCPD